MHLVVMLSCSPTDALSTGFLGATNVGVADLLLPGETVGLLSSARSLQASLALARFALGWSLFVGDAKRFPRFN